jgi:hypothetical protein
MSVTINKSIPKISKKTVWNTYIGADVGKTKCLICQETDIQQCEFHCAHVIAKSRGGSNEVENLRPICATCNLSMSNYNMMDFAQAFFPQSPILKDYTPMTTSLPFVEGLTSTVLPFMASESNQRLEPIQDDVQSEEKKKSAPCPSCGKTFSSDVYLNTHVKKQICEKRKKKKSYTSDPDQNPAKSSNVTLVNFGEEGSPQFLAQKLSADLDYIVEHELDNCVQALTKLMHKGDKYPEYHNIRGNKNHPDTVFIWRDGQFFERDQIEIFSQLIDSKIAIFEEYFLRKQVIQDQCVISGGFPPDPPANDQYQSNWYFLKI